MKKIFIRSPYFIEINEAGQTGAKIEIFLWNKGTTEPIIPNYILSKKYSSSFSTDVLILQYILKKAGYEKSIKQPYYSIKESKEKTTVLTNQCLSAALDS